jgi:hypothetical protein
MTSRLFTIAASLALLMAGAARADTTIYKCVDSEGRIEFTDSAKKNCKVLDLPSSIAAPAKARSGPAPAKPGAQPASAPADFPKVSS